MYVEIEDVSLSWCNNIEMIQEDFLSILALRLAGCECGLPLLGQRKITGKNLYLPRCRLCNTEICLEIT